MVSGKRAGVVEVYLFEEKPDIDEGPFLKEERGLINAIAENIGHIIERLRAEDARKKSEERLQRAIFASPFPIMIHAEDGEILQLSNVWSKITGYTVEELQTVGDWSIRAYGERHEFVKEYIDKLYSLDKEFDEGEWTVKIKNGQERIWHFSSAPLGNLPGGRRLLIEPNLNK